MLEIKNLSKNFSGFQAINSVNFLLEEGTRHAIIGPNGAGKTTFFNL
ncbi:MAG: ATP-binding cassette domain-containing protein, partial [Gammaproteobacteria bacterium]|nr:ATP-binding cassette domain-containing protein [Gammaproteobacteria bacterium]